MPINEIGTIYTPSIYGRTAFPLKHNGDPIFYKKFNSEDSEVVSTNKDIINIPNHFFKTGEQLKYSFNPATDTAVGISTLSPGASPTTNQLPSIVYPIIVDKDNIRVALGASYALQNQYVNITSLGIGTEHSFEAVKQNSKCLITINNVIQSPISVGSTVKVLAHTEINLTLESLENIKIGTCLKIGNEIVRVAAINYDLNKVSVSRGPNILGTTVTTFSPTLDGTYIDILSGQYNIVKDVINFDEPPLEGKKIVTKVLTTDIRYEDYSFNFQTDTLKTGSQVLILWENPPQELSNQKFYFLIKNSADNFSLASSYYNAFQKIKVTFSNVSENEFPVSDFKLVYFYPSEENAFTGRVFLRSNYDGNLVFDDVSQQFTGINSSFELKSSGISTVGIKSDNGILLVNNVFQYPGSDEAFSFVESGSSTYVNFVGFGTTGFTGKSYDVNVKGYPRGGIIVSYGTTSGTKYTPLSKYSNIPLSGSSAGIGASISFDADEYGNVRNLIFTNPGYNYKVGEILIPLNTTGDITQVDDDKLHIKINGVAKDAFNAWNVGILDKLDDLSDKVTGFRKTFSLTKNGQKISLESSSEYEVELKYNLLVFVNDILQIPDVSYKFNRGSIITFTEPIPKGSNVKIYFYKGSYNDTILDTNVSRLKEGDILQVQQDFDSPPPFEENKRIIKEIITSDTLRTNVYSDVGLSEDSSQLRSISWTAQKADLIIDGQYVDKSRELLKSNDIKFVGVGTNIGIGTVLGTFVGLSTNIIQVNTVSGIGTYIQVGDYVESSYIGYGISVSSVGSNYITIGDDGDLWKYECDNTQDPPECSWYNLGKKGVSGNIIGTINNVQSTGDPILLLNSTFPSAVDGDGVYDLNTSIRSSSPVGTNSEVISIWRKQ